MDQNENSKWVQDKCREKFGSRVDRDALAKFWLHIAPQSIVDTEFMKLMRSTPDWKLMDQHFAIEEEPDA